MCVYTSSIKLDQCYDEWTGRFFENNMDRIRLAVAETNLQILTEGFSSLNDFYGSLGMTSVRSGDSIGWSTIQPLEVSFGAMVADNDRPALVVSFRHDPSPLPSAL